jgi:uncharacterized membrane protein YecN with MAPEG domain
MALTNKQASVIKRMIVGVSIAFAIVAVGSFFGSHFFEPTVSIVERLSLAIQWLLIPAMFLIVSVGRLARHRFFTPEDIDGGGFSDNSEQAKILQAILQNTLEQFCIAFAIYLAWAIIMPTQALLVIPLAAVVFSIGRILFFVGYNGGAPSRALGFTLTYYPSLVMFGCILVYSLWSLFS